MAYLDYTPMSFVFSIQPVNWPRPDVEGTRENFVLCGEGYVQELTAIGQVCSGQDLDH